MTDSKDSGEAYKIVWKINVPESKEVFQIVRHVKKDMETSLKGLPGQIWSWLGHP